MDTSEPGSRIKALCEKHWEKHRSDCSGFVKAVTSELGVVLTGQANDIVAQMQKGSWRLLASGGAAREQATAGSLVLGGLVDQPHGHVVIVVPGPLAHGKYPTAYWGSLGGVGRKETTVNWSWSSVDRDRVLYSALHVAGAPR